MYRALLASTVLVHCLTTTYVQAEMIQFDQNVTPEVIFGSGNANGSWTTHRENGVEVGLRAKVRFPVPSNTFNSNGDGTYSHLAGSQGAAALWNYEFAANSDFDESSGFTLADLDFILAVDTDPSSAVSFVCGNIFQAEGGFFSDNAVGDNSTANGAGTPSNDLLVYGPLTVAQNSQNIGWAGLVTGNATWDFQLTALQHGTSTVLASTSMQVIVGQGGPIVPEPTSFAIFSIGALCVSGFASRRRRS